jgi:hypothetical protein
MFRRRSRVLSVALVLAMTTACSFHSVATHWNGRIGHDGHPVYVRQVTNVGVNLAIIVPLFGNITIDDMIDESTFAIADKGSDHVRVIESSSENYWHGFPPFTWFLTPVITEVTVEYRPSEQEIAEVMAAGKHPDDTPEQPPEQEKPNDPPKPAR